ncbi:MAG: hypothetical protein CMF96_03665 [Candidatus Marinimicrobia bacterium]|nr:hypothetical protein [Candidatus Neomarinimicrobiota bacterium]|tara:strand:- start:1689 stop:3284 length:1596 start_codon:yes stop_codon:yes gene_type:complete
MKTGIHKVNKLYVNVKVDDTFYFEKRKHDYVYFKGSFYYNGKWFSGKSAINILFNMLPNIPDVGFFCILYEINKVFGAYVDKIRSFPLFYYTKGNNFFISCFLNSLHELGEKYIFDMFSSSGFVLGKNTLLKEVYQIEAGSSLNYKPGDSNMIIKDYFSYKPSFTVNKFNYFEKVLNEIFQRLIDYSNGRRIVIPLSGGLDSRIIAVFLKKLNYKNIICFSYGTKGHKDVITSKKIANKLGIKWFFVEYESSKWKELLDDKVFSNYLKFSSNYSSLPHIQDYLAVSELKAKKIILENDIIVPGHTGDFISGGHIPFKYKENLVFEKKQLLKDIILKHFRVNNVQNLRSESLEMISQSIIDVLGIKDKNIFNNIECAQLFETFDWKERQCKFIINSIRVYDFFKLDWYLPLWDSKFIDFWSERSLDEKLQKKLYKIELEKIFPNYFCGINNKSISLMNKYKKNYILYFIIKYLKVLEQFFLDRSKVYRDYFYHPLKWYSLFPFRTVIKKRGFQNINSYLVDYFINKYTIHKK